MNVLILNQDRFDPFFLEAVNAAGITVDAIEGPNNPHINEWGVPALPALVKLDEAGSVVKIATTLADVRAF